MIDIYPLNRYTHNMIKSFKGKETEKIYHRKNFFLMPTGGNPRAFRPWVVDDRQCRKVG